MPHPYGDRGIVSNRRIGTRSLCSWSDLQMSFKVTGNVTFWYITYEFLISIPLQLCPYLVQHCVLPFFLSPEDAVRPIALNFAWTERHCHACKTPRSMYPSVYNSFRFSNHNCKKSPFLRTMAFIFCLPGDASVAITQNVAWMNRQFSACQTPRSMYPSIFNSFPVIRTTNAKNRRFHVPQPTSVSPEDDPAIITQYVAWINRQFNACQTPRSTYLSIFNSFRVIRCLSQCVSTKNRYFYHIFVSPGDAPGAITLNVVWMER